MIRHLWDLKCLQIIHNNSYNSYSLIFNAWCFFLFFPPPAQVPMLS